MICQDCQGSGKGYYPVHDETGAIEIPCPGCGGHGSMSCCEGAVGCAEDVPGQTGDE